MKFWSFMNLPLGHVRSHKKFEPDRFSRLDIYWIKTNRFTNRQAKYIYIQGVPKKRSLRHCSTHYGSIFKKCTFLKSLEQFRSININERYVALKLRKYWPFKVCHFGWVEFIYYFFRILNILWNLIRVWKICKSFQQKLKMQLLLSNGKTSVHNTGK